MVATPACSENPEFFGEQTQDIIYSIKVNLLKNLVLLPFFLLSACATQNISVVSNTALKDRCTASVSCTEFYKLKDPIREDENFESSEFILKTANRNPKGTALDLNENGAYGDKNKAHDVTKLGPWFIDNQKPGADVIIAGIYKSDADAIGRGIKILKWGFNQQREDGSYTSGDVYHTVSYFLAVASRAVLHLKNSKFESQFTEDISYLKIGIEKTANWLIQKNVEEPGLKIDAPYVHRFYMNGVALGLSGVLLNREDLILRSRELIKQGLARQNPDGSNPEKGGTDTSYHALGLYFAAQYDSIVADAGFKKDLRAMGEKGAKWLASKVLENGDIDASENTRTGPNGEKRYGTELKTITYLMIYKSLAYWGRILNAPDLTQAAKKVFDFNETLRKR